MGQILKDKQCRKKREKDEAEKCGHSCISGRKGFGVWGAGGRKRERTRERARRRIYERGN